jgi:hypothetical protein
MADLAIGCEAARGIELRKMKLGLTSGYNFVGGWIFVAILLNSVAPVQATTVPHSVLEVRVTDSGSVSTLTHLTTEETESYSVLYVMLPFPLRGEHIETKPETLTASTDVGSDSSLIVVIVPPRTSSIKFALGPTELVKAVDPTTWKVELDFRYPNPPGALDWVLQQRNVVFRMDEVWLTLPENVVVVDQSKQPAHWDARTKRKYTLAPDDETFVVSWRGGPTRKALIMDSLTNGFLGLLTAIGFGFALYINSKFLPAVLVAALALVGLIVRLYQAWYRPGFPWNDGLPVAATFFGVFLAFTLTVAFIRYRPHKPATATP